MFESNLSAMNPNRNIALKRVISFSRLVVVVGIGPQSSERQILIFVSGAFSPSERAAQRSFTSCRCDDGWTGGNRKCGGRAQEDPPWLAVSSRRFLWAALPQHTSDTLHCWCTETIRRLFVPHTCFGKNQRACVCFLPPPPCCRLEQTC